MGFHTDQVILDASDESNADDAAPTIRALLKVSNEIGKRLTLDSLLPSILDGPVQYFSSGQHRVDIAPRN